MWNSFKGPVALIGVPLLLMGILLLSSCGSSTASGGKASSSSGANSSFGRVALEVPTIWCSTCKPRVEASARNVPGVIDVGFDKERIQVVIVTYDPALTTPGAIVEAIEKGGDKVAKVTEQ